MASDQKAAQQRWELENDISKVDAGDDAYYKYDHASQQALQQQKPWTKDPHYFKQCAPLSLKPPRLGPFTSPPTDAACLQHLQHLEPAPSAALVGMHAHACRPCMSHACRCAPEGYQLYVAA